MMTTFAPFKYGASTGINLICTGQFSNRDGTAHAFLDGSVAASFTGFEEGQTNEAGGFWAWCLTASASNSSASLSSMVIASWGHAPMQVPSPSQWLSLTRRALPSIICIAPSAQAITHRPQPSHFSSSILIIRLTAKVFTY